MTSHLTKQSLVDYLAAGCKSSSDWRIGTEHEKFLFQADSLKRFSYQGEEGIGQLMQTLQTTYGWEPVYEHGESIALKIPHKRASITLEPGGQFELSGAPLKTLHETKDELTHHLKQVGDVVHDMGGILCPLGVDPLWSRQEISWMPKGRYDIMRAYMPTKGNLGIDMMVRTCTVQVNLDFASEADMVEKMRIGMAFQPLVTALFACSPILERHLTPYQSYRAHIWRDTDPDRSGILPFVFDPDMGFERYVDYLLDVPMYFVYRDGNYINAMGQSFRDFMTGHLPAYPGHYPTMKDWMDQTTIAFPEVRLKRFLEMRGADSGPPEMLLALPALWVGLLYDSIAQDEALQLIQSWSVPQIQQMHEDVPMYGLQTKIANQTLQDIARDVVDMSYRGLQRRAKLQHSQDESGYLLPLKEIAETGQTHALRMRELLKNGSIPEDIVRQYQI